MDIVDDWGGFEKLVAALHETGSVKVEHNVKLVGRSGAERQIDVLVTHHEGLYEHKILVECKYWKTSVKRTHIDAMVAAMEDLNASKGVFFTTKGYQSGAEAVAKAKGIEIYLVREMSPEEWGLPGRVIDVFLHTIRRAIGNIKLPGASVMRPSGRNEPPGKLAMAVGARGFTSRTPILERDGRESPRTLEAVLESQSIEALKRMTTPPVVFNDGADSTIHMLNPVELSFEPPILIRHGLDEILICSKLECNVAIRIQQSRIRIDRAAKYLFALAVENCITGVTHAATRERNSPLSSLAVIRPTGDLDREDAVDNGSILRVTMEAYFDFKEVEGLEEVGWPLGTPWPPPALISRPPVVS